MRHDKMRQGRLTSGRGIAAFRCGAIVCAAALWVSPVAIGAPVQAGTTPEAKPEPAKKQEPQQEPKKEPPKEQEPPKKDDKDLKELNPFDLPPVGGGGGTEEEMEELFMKVDKRLQRVSELLFEASTGDPSRAKDIGSSGIDELIRAAESSSGAGASGIAQLLEATRMQSEAAELEIDRILELAAENQSKGSGGPPNQPPSQSGEVPQQGKTPSGSKKEEKGENPPQGEGQKPKSEQQDGQEQKDGETPSGGQEQEGSEDGPGKKPPGSEIGDPSNAAGNEDWGDLPVHLRKVFQNGVSDDVPPRYRDWVDSYYKRLNRSSGR